MNDPLLDSKQRVFFALWPDGAERSAFSAWQDTLKDLCGGREMRDDSLHATLVFLGEVEAARMAALQLAAQEVIAERFELCFDAARYWEHNHILYAAPGVTPAPLQHLVTELEQALRRHRFSFEERSFQPHVTLRRNARWTPLPAMLPVRWRVREFVLLRSEPGASYRVLAHFPLRRAALRDNTHL